MTYGTTIKQAREAKSMTQEQLAEALDISRQAVSKWEADLSRPTRGKLERLSEILDLPPDTWSLIDAEMAAASLPPDRSRPWKLAAAGLAALSLLLAAALAAVLWRHAHPSTLIPSEEAAADSQPSVISLPDIFPETLPLRASHDFHFGSAPAGGPFDPSLVPFLEDNLEIQEREIWSGSLGDLDDPQCPALSLSVVTVNPVHENRTTFYDVYLLWARPDEAGNLRWQIFTCLADYNHYVNQGEVGFWAERFTNVLGFDGWKLSIVIGASAGDLDYYIIQTPDGSPALLTTSYKAQEADIDEDGVKEIVSESGNPWICEIVDTAEGTEGAFRYTLDPHRDGFANVGISFDSDKGGFVVTDSQDAVLVRYVLREGEMVRLPMTDFTAMDYPDAAGARISFVTHDGDGLADGREPDDVLYNGKTRITHRQQAHLALQELYNLTGIQVDECYCAANEFGVLFSTLPDGFNQRSFFALDFPETYGGSAIPGFRIAWRELGNDWSPLSLADAERPESWVAPETLLRWYYDRLEILRTGETALETDGSFPGERNLYLEDGALYVGYFQETDQGPVLENLLGPYPDGMANH